jgi:predicted NUDIX family phosphoesterase
MSKSALVVSVEDYNTKPSKDWATFMMPRELCETDERYLQILPYVIVVNEYNEYFSYERGSSGAEARLHAKRSIGLGGHIDNPVTTTLDDLIVKEAARELLEEVGLVVSEDALRAGLMNAFTIRETATPVDRVHLGIAFTIRVHSSEFEKLEDGVIINPLWLSRQTARMHFTIKNLVKPEMLKWEFETWSNVYLMHDLDILDDVAIFGIATGLDEYI